MLDHGLLDAYERELGALRGRGAAFAARHPKVAGRLGLHSAGASDPHVERLIEAFAFLTARVQRRVDQQPAEMAQALLSVLHPQLLAPIPSMAIAEMALDPQQGRAPAGREVPALTPLLAPAVDGVRAKFRTAYPVTLWPLTVCSVAIHGVSPDQGLGASIRSVLEIGLETTGGFFLKDLATPALRFFLHGSEALTGKLYAALLHEAVEVELVDERGVTLWREDGEVALRPVALGDRLSLFPQDQNAPPGHGLLLTYFAFREALLFVEAGPWGDAFRRAEGTNMTLRVGLRLSSRALPPALGRENLRLGATPIVNLFPKIAEPLAVDPGRTEYTVVPDRFRPGALEVHSVTEVRGILGGGREVRSYRPFFTEGPGDEGQGRYHVVRRPSLAPVGAETDVRLRLVRETGSGAEGDELLQVQTLCTHHDLPSRLPFGELRADFVAEGVPLLALKCLTKPTPSRRLGMDGGIPWRLVSFLSSGLSGITGDIDILRRVLSLYSVDPDAWVQAQLDGLEALSLEPMATQLPGRGAQGGSGWVRGLRVNLRLASRAFVGGTPHLLVAVLDAFFAARTPINGVTQLQAFLDQSETPIISLRPRIGGRAYL